MKIDVLYFEDCPSWKTACANLEVAAQLEGVQLAVDLIEVKTDQEASKLKFLGSPSFQLNGQDLWPENRETYSLSCRVYKTPEGLKGWPTIEMFRQKLQTYTSKL
ncbi:MAG: thioredoxin family protein [Chloroflexi bacterium]|nr:thioredoxin family protein [Chloroflexota bacterium]